MRFLGYVVTIYLGGFVVGLPLGFALSLGLSRRLAPYTRWVVDVGPVDPALSTDEGLAAVRLRWTTRALIGTGAALGCGIAAAVHQHYFGTGNLLVWQIAMMICAASFWNFNLLLALPAVAGWLLTYVLLR